MTTRKFREDKYYVIEDASYITRLNEVAKLLYAEKTINGDTMRNMAQAIDSVLDTLVETDFL